MVSRSSKRAAVAGVLLLCALVLASPYVSAHAEFVSSFPAPYEILFRYNLTEVRVTVSEAVQPGSASITVTNQTNVRFDRGPTNLSANDPTTFSVAVSGVGPGVYTVVWSAISADDGHFNTGAFYFMVRNLDGSLPGTFPLGGPSGSAAASPVDIALRAADFIAFALAFGTLFFVLLLWLPMRSDLEGKLAEEAAGEERGLLRIARWGSVAFLLAVAGQWIENLVVSPPSSLGDLLASVYLTSLVLRIAFAAAMVLLLSWDLRRGGRGAHMAERPGLVATAAVAFAAILADVFASHSAVVEAWWPLGPLVDAIHLYGAALWVGGLAAVLFVQRWLTRAAPAEFAQAVLIGFSRTAFLAVGLIVLGGAFLAVILVGNLDSLWTTGYGWLVLGKIALLAPMLVLGAWNHRTLRRTPEAAPPAAARTAAVGRRVRAEVALGVAVLVLAGWLTTVNPATLAPGQPEFILTASGGGLYAIFDVVPYPETPGTYTFELEAWVESNGSQYIGVGSVNNTLSFSVDGGPPTVLPLDGPHGPNHFVLADTDVISRPGTWHILAHLQRTDGSSVEFSFDVPIHG